MAHRETYDVTVQRHRTPDHEVLTSMDTVTYRVTGKDPAEARRKASEQAKRRYPEGFTIIAQDRRD